MTLYHRSSEKRRMFNDFRRQEEEVIGSLCRLSNRPISPKTQLEQEKRIRREIANSNERRRMQSINAGFQSLRTLLPHHDGEKLSKAAILQHTAEYIYQLEQEKTRLLSQNCQLKRLISSQMSQDSDGSSSDSPLPKRKKTDTVESVDEGIGSMSPPSGETNKDDLKREMIELRVQLDRERRLRMILEEQTRNLEMQLYPDRIREITNQVQLQYNSNEEDNQDPDPDPDKMFTKTDILESSSQPSSPHSEPEQKVSPAHCPANPDLPQDLSRHSSTTENVVSPPKIPSPEPEMHPAKDERCSPPPESVPVQGRFASTSRQNLETIVEAIRHLEGDRFLEDDPPEPSRYESVGSPVAREEESTPSNCVTVTASVDSRHSLVRSASEYTYRHQVIHCSPVTQTRPGVIVANHS